MFYCHFPPDYLIEGILKGKYFNEIGLIIPLQVASLLNVAFKMTKYLNFLLLNYLWQVFKKIKGTTKMISRTWKEICSCETQFISVLNYLSQPY